MPFQRGRFFFPENNPREHWTTSVTLQMGWVKDKQPCVGLQWGPADHSRPPIVCIATLLRHSSQTRKFAIRHPLVISSFLLLSPQCNLRTFSVFLRETHALLAHSSPSSSSVGPETTLLRCLLRVHFRETESNNIWSLASSFFLLACFHGYQHVAGSSMSLSLSASVLQMWHISFAQLSFERVVSVFQLFWITLHHDPC